MSVYLKKFYYNIEVELYKAAESEGLTPRFVESTWHGDHGTFSTELWQYDLGRLDQHIVRDNWSQDWIDQLVLAVRHLPMMLAKLHRIGIIHNDLSPFNIVIRRNCRDDGWDIAFIDFDISVESTEQNYQEREKLRLSGVIHGIGKDLKKVICSEVGNNNCPDCDEFRRQSNHPRVQNVN